MTTYHYSGLSDLRSRLTHGHSARSHSRFRVFMFIEAISFFFAALVHGGVLIHGREHTVIHVGETFMGIVLATGVVASGLLPAHARTIAFGTQAFAFFATVLGLLLIAVGLGPSSVPGLMFNAAVLLLLCLGLFFASRTP